MELLEKEAKLIRTFVRGQLWDEPDLSTLTIRILKNRYLAHVQGDTLSPEAKSFMKQVVQEEILKMQDSDNSESEVGNQRAQKKRKRTNELLSEEEDEFVAKKLRQSPTLSESKDKAEIITKDEENKTEAQSHSGSDNKKQVMNKSQKQSKTQESSEESIDEDEDEDENGIETGENGDSSPEEVEKSKANTLKDSGTAGKIPSHEKETSQSNEDSDGDDVSEKSEKTKNDPSSNVSDQEKPSEEKKIKDDTDSDSSSLPSLEDEDDKGKGNAQEKKKNEGKKHSEETKKSDKAGQKDEHKSVVRLKRFISLCGVRRNYKKLLDGCRSVRSQVAVLKKELEDLGVHGKPSVERCKKIRMKREEAQELAELDVNNIISKQGRPKRRGASVWQEQQEPPSSTYARALNSGSDSDEENKMNRGCRRTTDWSNLQGIISDDADSD